MIAIAKRIHSLLYPLGCVLSLVLLPYQPAQEGPLAATADEAPAATLLHCPLRP
ncbi:MAG: hypothetical protein ABW005_01030 [Burkholderiaceae bacterium]